ncbi:MAG: hypothetical protein R3B60_00595 [Candidatus Paceibacterota bacterium]
MSDTQTKFSTEKINDLTGYENTLQFLGYGHLLKEGIKLLHRNKVKLFFQTLVIIGVVFLSILYINAFFGNYPESAFSTSYTLKYFFLFFAFLILPLYIFLNSLVLIIIYALYENNDISVDQEKLLKLNKYNLATLIFVAASLAFSVLVLSSIVSNSYLIGFLMVAYSYLVLSYFFATVLIVKGFTSVLLAFMESAKLIKRNFKIISGCTLFSLASVSLMLLALYAFAVFIPMTNLNPFLGLLLFLLIFSTLIYLVSLVIVSAVVLLRMIHK